MSISIILVSGDQVHTVSGRITSTATMPVTTEHDMAADCQTPFVIREF